MALAIIEDIYCVVNAILTIRSNVKKKIGNCEDLMFRIERISPMLKELQKDSNNVVKMESSFAIDILQGFLASLREMKVFIDTLNAKSVFSSVTNVVLGNSDKSLTNIVVD